MANKVDKVLRFKEMFETYDIFDNEIIKPIQAMYPGVKWLDPLMMNTSFETLYKLFIAKHGEKFVRYDYAQAVGIFQLELIDKLPDLYVKQSVISDESLAKLVDFAERGFATVVEGNVGGTDTPNNSGKEIEIKDGENVTRKQASKSSSKAFNFVSDLQNLLSTKISTYMIDFLDIFNDTLFVTPQLQAKLEGIQDSIILNSFFGKLILSLKAGAGISFVIDQNGETIEIQNSIHPHVTNGNTDPETETIKLEDNDIGGTYNLKTIIDDLKAIRDQANAIGDHEFKDENGNLISFDDNNDPKQVYTVEAIDGIIKRVVDDHANKDLSNVNVGVANAGKIAKVKADGGLEYVVVPIPYGYEEKEITITPAVYGWVKKDNFWDGGLAQWDGKQMRLTFLKGAEILRVLTSVTTINNGNYQYLAPSENNANNNYNPYYIVETKPDKIQGGPTGGEFNIIKAEIWDIITPAVKGIVTVKK